MESVRPFPPPGDANRAVLITNLSLLASETDLEEVFSFCGKISALQIRKGDPAAQAVVVFDSRSAQMAALLLNETSILDQKVRVAPAPDVWTFLDGETVAPANADDSGPVDARGAPGFTVNEGPPPMSAAAAQSMVSNLWSKVAETARNASAAVENNEKLWSAVDSAEAAAARAGENIVKTAETAGEKTRQTWAGIDSNYHVSEKTTAAVGTVTRSTKQGAQTLDQRLGISTAAKGAKSAIGVLAHEIDENLAVSEKTNQIRMKAMNNEAIRNGVEVISESWEDLLGRVKTQQQAGTAQTPDPTPGAEPRSNMLDEDFELGGKAPGSKDEQSKQ